jgi:LAO/AO transport system kinase
MLPLTKRVLAGDRRAVSKAISFVENKEDDYSTLLREIYPHTGRASVVGVTGPPGTGKSSIVDRLLSLCRKKDYRVAVLAVDPTSPMTGGAILGDRVRMLEHALDPRVYIRSMASRGDPGGLSRAAKDSVRILDAAGNDIVFVETVGIGQAEIEIVGVADSVLVVVMPELGDEIQANKAGLMEIGDIFAVNKSDLPGADRVVYNLQSVLSSKNGWKQPVLKISAKTSEGLETLLSKVEEHVKYAKEPERAAKRMAAKLREELIENVTFMVSENLHTRLENDEDFRSLLGKVQKRKLDPETASNLLARKYLGGQPEKES